MSLPAAHPPASSCNRQRKKSELRTANKAGSDADRSWEMKAGSRGSRWRAGAGGLLPLLGALCPGRAGDSRWRWRPWYSWSPHRAGMLHNAVFRAASVTLGWCQPWLFTLAASQPLPNGAERLSRALPRSLPGGELPTEHC